MTPENIKQTWREANQQFGYDPIFGDVEAESLLHNPAGEDIKIAANIAGMQRVRDEVPEFFNKFDYDWAFDPTVWRREIEANFQARLFQILAMIWNSPNKRPDWRYENVVARYTFDASTEPGTPYHVARDSCGFIISPFSFNENVLLLLRAFIGSLNGRSGWDDFLGFKTFAVHPSPFLKQALLRHLTSDAFHAGFLGEDPVSKVKRKSLWFGDAAEHGVINDEVEGPLSVALIDFALAHELGHHLLGHTGTSNVADLTLDKERDADAAGFFGYSTSWGWRDELIDPCPLNPGPRILLGPLMFHLLVKWTLTLRQGTEYAKLGKSVQQGEHQNFYQSDAEHSALRSDATFKQVGLYESDVLSRGATFTADDNALYAAIARAGAAFTLHIFQAAANIPKDDLTIAIEAGDIGF